MNRESVPVLAARGVLSAAAAWKALLLVLLLNAALSFALARPVASALHAALDSSPAAARLLANDKATFFAHWQRTRPEVLGDVGAFDDLATGDVPKESFLSLTGAAGVAVWLGLAYALVGSVLSGGFAARFASDEDRGSLATFGADCGRFAPASLALGLVQLAGLVLAYRYVFGASAGLLEPAELRYEWEATALLLARLAALLVVAGFVRILVLYARAAMALSGRANPLQALASGAGFVLGRPVRTMALEILFGVAGLVPIAIWIAVGPRWDGRDLRALAIALLVQELLVLLRIGTRAAHLGAAVSFVRRSREGARPAEARPVRRAAPEAAAPEPAPAPATEP